MKKIILYSSGRSGSTWVSSNLINYKKTYNYAFEPFSPFGKKNSQEERYYLRLSENHDVIINTFNDIFERKYESHSCTYINSDKFLIKSIRMNFFTFSLKIFLIDNYSPYY